MAPIRTIKANEVDNIAIPVEDLPAGISTDGGIAAAEHIPQGHKFALRDLYAGEAVVRYGVTLGYLDHPVARGALVNEHMLRIADAPSLDSLPAPGNVASTLPPAPVSHFEGYRSEERRVG